MMAHNFSHGGVDELKIWNVAHTSAEYVTACIPVIENASSANMMAYYRFDESGAGTADVSGNCNALTYVGTAPVFGAAGFPLGKPLVASQVRFRIGHATPVGSSDFAVNIQFIHRNRRYSICTPLRQGISKRHKSSY
jgi:hypothetical protein